MFRLILLVVCCFVFAPVFADTYTIDTRKYVSGEMRRVAPYKYVVQVLDMRDEVMCSATMVRGKIVTAFHCVDNPDPMSFRFRAFDGTIIRPASVVLGRDLGDELSPVPVGDIGWDWAVITPHRDSLDFVVANSINNIATGGGATLRYANDKWNGRISIGFGGMEIMSDTQIANFRRAFTEVFRELGLSSEGWRKDGVWLADFYNNENNENFLRAFFFRLQDYGVHTKNLFWDSERLKVSFCRLDKAGADSLKSEDMGCQSIDGDSGGGVFMTSAYNWNTDLFLPADEDAAYVGLISTGISYVGGARHMSRDATNIVPVDNFSHLLD